MESFSQLYQELVDAGYRRILSIHVSPTLSRTYRLAKEASTEIDDAVINVVNSHANGLGLGILIREVKDAIEHRFSPTEIAQLIIKSVKKMRQWWVPLNFNYLKNSEWLERTVDNRVRMKLKMFNLTPVISLKDDKIRLEESFLDENKALMYVLREAEGLKKSRVSRVGIEYRGHLAYRHAIALKINCK